MSKASTIQVIKNKVYENTNNEISGQMVQDAIIEVVNDEYVELDKKQDKLVSGTNIKTIQGNSLLGSGNINLTAGNIGAYSKAEVDAALNTKVPKTTTINGKALSDNITLTAADVSALPNDTKYAGSSSAGGAATSANKVNSSLSLQLNGGAATVFDGSGAKTFNVTPSGIGAAPASHTHNYAGSSSAGGAATSANKVNSSLSLQLNGGAATVFDGSGAKTFNVTPSAIGAASTADLNTKQATLVSGTNIKTINNTTLLGAGNIAVQPTLVSGTNIKTINGTSLLGSGDIAISGGADSNFSVVNIKWQDMGTEFPNIELIKEDNTGKMYLRWGNSHTFIGDYENKKGILSTTIDVYGGYSQIIKNAIKIQVSDKNGNVSKQLASQHYLIPRTGEFMEHVITSQVTIPIYNITEVHNLEVLISEYNPR